MALGSIDQSITGVIIYHHVFLTKLETVRKNSQEEEEELVRFIQ